MKRKSTFYEKYIKRLLDIICAILALVFFCWLYLLIAILVKIFLGSPVIFRQLRPGKDENIFELYKFRTMTDKKDENGNLLPDALRLTKFGKMLRKTSLDELPEAINILNGSMSVVGPRPQLVKDMVFMTDEQRKRHRVRPGLSGLAQTRGRNALDWEVKLSTDLEYIERITFLGDLKIVCDTVKQVFFHKKGLDSHNVKEINQNRDEIEITDDLGDYLLKTSKITYDEYEYQINEAQELIKKHKMGKKKWN